MESTHDLELTNEQLVEIFDLAERVQKGEASIANSDLAFCLQAVALCLHCLQAGGPESPVGTAVDDWYDTTIGEKVRMMWVKVKPVTQQLQRRGILD
ncbi:MAG: hypothetical protein HYX68_01675 [Planctomycetes bacterium]|nr:hypothetical protein [Planctomycetota bacterium]